MEKNNPSPDGFAQNEPGKTESKDEQIFREYNKKAKPINTINLILFILLVIDGAIAIVYPKIIVVYIAIALLVLVAINLIVGMRLKVFKCPYCGSTLFRGADTSCPSCGKKIK